MVKTIGSNQSKRNYTIIDDTCYLMLQTQYKIQLSYYTMPNTCYFFFFNLKVRKKNSMLDMEYSLHATQYSLLTFQKMHDKALLVARYSILDAIHFLLDT